MLDNYFQLFNTSFVKEFSRRLNFFSASFIGILGFSLTSEIFLEKDLDDKIDDILMVLLSVVSILWYKRKGYNTSSALGSVVIVGAGLVIKIVAIIIEHADKEALGDDIGVMIALVLALVFVIWQTFGHRGAMK